MEWTKEADYEEIESWFPRGNNPKMQIDLFLPCPDSCNHRTKFTVQLQTFHPERTSGPFYQTPVRKTFEGESDARAFIRELMENPTKYVVMENL